jgi:hypothetical protein
MLDGTKGRELPDDVPDAYLHRARFASLGGDVGGP